MSKTQGQDKSPTPHLAIKLLVNLDSVPVPKLSGHASLTRPHRQEALCRVPNGLIPHCPSSGSSIPCLECSPMPQPVVYFSQASSDHTPPPLQQINLSMGLGLCSSHSATVPSAPLKRECLKVRTCPFILHPQRPVGCLELNRCQCVPSVNQGDYHFNISSKSK